MLIDSHQHFWRYNAEEYDWIDNSMAMLQRDFLPSDLAGELAAARLDGCVAVQARQTIEETDWLLTLAAQNDIIKGVVGWIDLMAGDLSEQLARYQGSADLKGFRYVLQGEPDDHFMMQPEFLRGVQALATAGYSYDILVFSRHLPVVKDFIEALPDMPLVIDHIAKPAIRDGEWQPWADAIAQTAKFDNVMCKISGLVTEAKWSAWDKADLQRYMHHVLECFGPKRVMYGSDWPVCTLAADYQTVFALLDDMVSAGERAAIMGGNACRFYDL